MVEDGGFPAMGDGRRSGTAAVGVVDGDLGVAMEEGEVL